MSMDVQTSMRLPAELLQRADSLIESLQHDPALSMMGKMTRSKVLRLALSEGLKSLEAQSRFRPPSATLRPRSSLVETDAHQDPAPVTTPRQTAPLPTADPISTPSMAMEED